MHCAAKTEKSEKIHNHDGFIVCSLSYGKGKGKAMMIDGRR